MLHARPRPTTAAYDPKSRLKQTRGAICGVRVEEIDDPVMQGIRYLDKLIDELAKGWPIEKILRLGP
jgi:hypothetical protein